MESEIAAELKALKRGRGVHLGRLTAVLAARYGDRPAMENPGATPGLHPGGWRTYADLEHAVARLAAAHAAAGVTAGDRAMVMIDNRPDVALHAFALARVGAVPTLVNARLRPHEVAAIRQATDSIHLVVDDDLADELRTVDELADLRWHLTGLRGDQSSIAGWLDANPGTTLDSEPGRSAEETAVFLTTSGTTGVPKAAALSSRGLLETPGRLATLPVARDRWPRAGRDLVVASVPLAHVMGLGLVLGMTCAGVPLMHRSRFDAAEILDLIERRRPNVFIGVPTMYADLEAAGAAQRDLSSIQLFASSADAMPSERARRFQSYGSWVKVGSRRLGNAIFVDGYGMVELSGAGAIRLYPPGSSRMKLPSVAKVVPGLEVRAVDETGNPVGRGRAGELQFRGPAVLARYEGHDDAGPDTDGWLSTGDFARVYPGGFFQFSGRHKDRLKIGGFSVFPAEVEEELAQHPGVREVALVGVPEDRLGERPVALVVPWNDEFDVADFLAWAQENVAGYRCPRTAYVVTEIPRGNNHKIDRRRATEIGERLESAAGVPG